MPRPTVVAMIPSDQDLALAREASRVLNEIGGSEPALRIQLIAAGKECPMLDLPAPAAKLLLQMLQEMAAGHAVTLLPLATEITTQQAADLLNVSRPFVAGLVDKGVLPARMVGANRRLLLQDVQAYRLESRARARGALKEMIAISQELGLE